MSVTLTQPVAGLDRGQNYSGPMEGWLLAYGYASLNDGLDKANISPPGQSKDPQLAANREAPDADVPSGVAATPQTVAAPVETGEREPAPLPAAREATIGGNADETAPELDGRVATADIQGAVQPEPAEALTVPTVGTPATKADTAKRTSKGDRKHNEPGADKAPLPAGEATELPFTVGTTPPA